jgi:hypothetical protein
MTMLIVFAVAVCVFLFFPFAALRAIQSLFASRTVGWKKIFCKKEDSTED